LQTSIEEYLMILTHELLGVLLPALNGVRIF
jgi:hypothetical protein